MTINAIEYLAPVVPIDLTTISPAGEQGSAGNIGFPQWFEKQLAQVNGQLLQSDGQLQQLAMGEAQNLHQVMIGMEEARLSFQLMVQVRNRVLEAYQDVMRMSI